MACATQLSIFDGFPFVLRRKEVVISTDGGCDPNPGFGGWAAILRCGAGYKEISGYEVQTTNNRMEMRAVLEALNALREPCDVLVRSDSQFVVVAFLNNPDRKPHKRANQDLVQAIRVAMRPHTVRAEWIRGHAGDPDNERCDILAGEMIRRAKASVDPFLAASAPQQTRGHPTAIPTG
jgi:ribonuclease HI